MRARFGIVAATAFFFVFTGDAEAREPKRDKVTKDAVIGACDEKLQSNRGVIGCTIGCKSGGKDAICDYSCGGKEGPGCRKYTFTRVETVRAGRGWLDLPRRPGAMEVR